MTSRRGKITIENPHRGWAQSNSITNRYNRSGLPGQYARSFAGVTLMRSGYERHMAPGFVFDPLTDASSRVNELPLNATTTRASNTQIWVMLRNARMVAFDLSDDTVDTTRTAIAQGLTIPTVPNHDILTHKISSGAERVFYSYDTSDATTKSNIGIMDNAGGNIDDDFFSTRTGGARLEIDVPLKMWVGPDSNVYSTNGQYVAVYDTVTDRANAQGLDLGQGWIATSGAKYKNYNVIVGYKSATHFLVGDTNTFYAGEVRVWFWNGYDPRYNFVYDIDDTISGAVEVIGDELRVYTAGKSKTTKIWRFNGSGFGVGPVEEIGGTSQSTPIHGSVGRFRNHSVFPSYNGSNLELLAYGSNDPKIETPGVHSLTGNDAWGGFTKELKNNVLYIGHGSSSFSIQKLNETKATESGNFISLNYSLPTNSTIEAIKFYFTIFGTGASININAFKNANENAFVSQTLTKAELSGNLFHAITESVRDSNFVTVEYSFVGSTTLATSVVIRKIEVEYSYESTLNY